MMNPWSILGAVVISIGIAGVSYYKGNEAGKAEVQQQWDHEKADMLAKHAEEVDRAREKERNWQQAADNIRQEKDREIRNINARAVALSNVVRQRQDRPAPNASGAAQTAGSGQAPTGCTGAELYKPDGEFLVREAARGDEIRAALKQCYAQYETVKGVLQSSK